MIAAGAIGDSRISICRPEEPMLAFTVGPLTRRNTEDRGKQRIKRDTSFPHPCNPRHPFKSVVKVARTFVDAISPSVFLRVRKFWLTPAPAGTPTSSKPSRSPIWRSISRMPLRPRLNQLSSNVARMTCNRVAGVKGFVRKCLTLACGLLPIPAPEARPLAAIILTAGLIRRRALIAAEPSMMGMDISVRTMSILCRCWA